VEENKKKILFIVILIYRCAWQFALA
jgi:hypothetical protein